VENVSGDKLFKTDKMTLSNSFLFIHKQMIKRKLDDIEYHREFMDKKERNIPNLNPDPMQCETDELM
jgi:hypothetical protein